MIVPLAIAAAIGAVIWLAARSRGGAGAGEPLTWAPSDAIGAGLDFGAGGGAGELAAVAGDVYEAAAPWAFLQNVELAGADIMQSIYTGAAAASSAARAAFTLPAAGAQYGAQITRAQERYGLPRDMLARLLQTESAFNAAAVGPVTRSGERAAGIAQFMPGTARELGIDPYNADASIDAAGKYLRRLFDALGSWPAAVAAYNWGIGNVQRKGLDAAPLETRNYLARVLPPGALDT